MYLCLEIVLINQPLIFEFQSEITNAGAARVQRCQSSDGLCNTIDEVRLRDGVVGHHYCHITSNYLHGRFGPSEWSTSAGAGFVPEHTSFPIRLCAKLCWFSSACSEDLLE